MKEILSKRIEALPQSGIRKINDRAIEMEQHGNAVIHLEIGRPDFDTPQYIKEEGIRNIENGNVFYTANMGDIKLRKAISDKLREQNHISYDPQTEIMVSAGLSEAIFDSLEAILDAGDEILVPDPVWINYVNVPKFIGARPIAYTLLEENDFQIDIREIRKKITKKTKAIVIVTPNNPTGSVLSRQILQELAELVKEQDIYVIADEVYERICYDAQEHVSIASLPGMKERTILFNGFSKAYSMTGWRLGYVAASKEIIKAINKVHQHLVTCAASFVQAAGVVALLYEKNEVEEMVEEYQRRRDFLVTEINQISGISCKKPKGAFYLFVNIKKLPYSSEEFAQMLLEREKVATVPGSVFGPGGEGYIRISFASSYENLTEAVKRIRHFISELEESRHEI